MEKRIKIIENEQMEMIKLIRILSKEVLKINQWIIANTQSSQKLKTGRLE